ELGAYGAGLHEEAGDALLPLRRAREHREVGREAGVRDEDLRAGEGPGPRLLLGTDGDPRDVAPGIGLRDGESEDGRATAGERQLRGRGAGQGERVSPESLNGEHGVHEGARVPDLFPGHAAEERALLRPVARADRRVEELAPRQIVDRALAGGDAFFRRAG